MATLNQGKTSKRRNRSSTSSTSSETYSISSPDQKKSRNEEEQPEMTAISEDIGDKLNNILTKLSKLDEICVSVKNIEQNLEKLEERTKSLEEFRESSLKDTKQLKEDLNKRDEMQETRVKATETELKSTKASMISLQKKFDDLEIKFQKKTGELAELHTKDLYLEAYSRRENIIFLNINEDPNEDTEAKLRNFLEEELEYRKFDTVEIQRVHRNQRKDNSRPRPIIARFLRYKDCEEILSLGRNLKGTSYSMFTDLPYEIVKRRKVLMPTYMKAKKQKIPVAFSKAKPDKLYVRGKEWIAGQDFHIFDSF